MDFVLILNSFNSKKESIKSSKSFLIVLNDESKVLVFEI